MADDLRDFVEAFAGSHLRVEDDLGGGFVRLRVSEAERRQAKHDIRSSEDIVIEMLRNARDAHAHRIFLATGRSGDERTFVMLDDGDGIPPEMHERVFEARVTSKLDSMRMDRWGVHGRGMALYSIRENCPFARVMDSGEGIGSSIAVRAHIGDIAERTDQSSFPELDYDADGCLTVRGPRNILRTVVEFALAEQDECAVYLGSQTEVASTLFWSARCGAFDEPSGSLVIAKLGRANTPAEFRQIAESLGLEMSERSARRAMDGEIPPLKPILALLDAKRPQRQRASTRKDAFADARGLKVAERDMERFKEALHAAWSDLAEAYFIDTSAEPSVIVRKDAVHVTFPVHKMQ